MIVHARFPDRIAGVGIGRVKSLLGLGEMPGEWSAALVRLERAPFSALLDASDAPLDGGPAARDLVAVLYTSCRNPQGRVPARPSQGRELDGAGRDAALPSSTAPAACTFARH